MSETKEVQLVTKCPQDLREAFVKVCKQQDTNASREVRAFMRDYIKRHGQAEMKL